MEPRLPRVLVIVIALLSVIVLTFATIRVVSDVPAIVGGRAGDDVFGARYVAHPVLGYLHIIPGVVFLAIAPFQLSRRFRRASPERHRRLGRLAVTAALVSGIYAIAFGSLHSFGGGAQAASAVVFGAWFLLCVGAAFTAIRRRDVAGHRRWMIRAFAVAIGVGTIRLWVGVLSGSGLLGFRESFGPAFWLGLTMHVAVGEWWLRRTRRAPHVGRRG